MHRFPCRYWLATLLIALALAGCTSEPPNSPTAPSVPVAGGSADASPFDQPRKPEGEIRIRIITNGISPFWDSMEKGMTRMAAELGDCDADWQGPQISSIAEQKRMIEDAVASGADGIAISVIESKATEPTINDLIRRGIPVITFDSDASGSQRLAYIGTNNYEAGKRLGEKAIELLPRGAKLCAFVGNISAENARERRDGFVDATKEHGIEILEIYDDNKDPNASRQNAENALIKFGDQLAGLFGIFSYNAPTITDAVLAAGRRDKLKLITFDAEPATLDHLEKGNIDATAVQSPYDMGRLSTQLLYLINRKGLKAAMEEMNIPANGILDTGVQIITPANIKEFRQHLAEIGVTSS